MTAPRRGPALLIAVVVAVGWGCVSTPDVASRTGGRTLVLDTHHPGNVRALYIVEKDGSLSFGGGQSAWLERTTWTGPMTDAEITELFGLIEAYGWYDEPPGPRKGDAMPVYDIRLTGPEGRAKYRVVGPGLGTEEVETLLATAARRRFDPLLQSLPKPSIEDLSRQHEQDRPADEQRGEP